MESEDLRRLSPLILAVDTASLKEAKKLAGEVHEYVDIVKVGLQLFSSVGPAAVKELKKEGFEVFLDIKLNDIPNTVVAACRALAELEPLMITVHTMGGQEMIQAALAALSEYCNAGSLRKPILIGVTLLTSFDLNTLMKVGINDAVESQVLRLAELALESGVRGLVTSPLEVLKVRELVGSEMILITPGVRVETIERDDQKRTASPADAVRSGADFVVVGRPIYGAPDPKTAAEGILSNIKKI